MAVEIGHLLFREILGMTEYPGSPFTGLIVNDLVMFFLIPTIFIILIVYMLLARLVPVENRGMRLLVGLGVYLFIIFGGYYSVFARLAGPYFIFLIFILGLLYFFLGHFGRGGGTYRASAGGFARESGYQMESSVPSNSIARLQRKIRSLEEQEKRVADLFKNDPKSLGNALAPIEQELVKLKMEAVDVGANMSWFKKAEERLKDLQHQAGLGR